MKTATTAIVLLQMGAFNQCTAKPTAPPLAPPSTADGKAAVQKAAAALHPAQLRVTMSATGDGQTTVFTAMMNTATGDGEFTAGQIRGGAQPSMMQQIRVGADRWVKMQGDQVSRWMHLPESQIPKDGSIVMVEPGFPVSVLKAWMPSPGPP